VTQSTCVPGTTTELLDELDSIEAYQHEGHQDRILHVTEKQTTIYDKLGIPAPTS